MTGPERRPRVPASRPAAERRTYRRLLGGLAGIILLAPLAAGVLGPVSIDDYLVVIVLLAALYDITRTRRTVAVALALGLPAITGRIVAAHLQQPAILVSGLVFASSAVFLCYLIGHILHDVLHGRRWSGDRIVGAMCAYLLLGYLWALVYGFLHVVQPGSLAIPERLLADGGKLAPFTYFSFVTLTTLGYGDIQPVSPVARTAAWTEAVVGQLYVAVMIARLVGLSVSGEDAADAG